MTIQRVSLGKGLTLLTLLLVASVAFAANVHFKGGKNAGPTFSDQGLTLNTVGCLSGLGNEDVTITVIASGIGTTTCTNPGGNQAPGINKKLSGLTGSQTISAEEIKNGNVCFNVTTAAPEDVTAAEAGCPNNNWDAAITDVDFTDARIFVEQGGEIVLERAFDGL